MKSKFSLLSLFGLMVCLLTTLSASSAFAADQCAEQLAAKDAQIATLMGIISNRSGGAAQTVTCQAMCIQNFIGTGWKHPGDLGAHNSIGVGTNAKEAFDAMAADCNANLQKVLREQNGAYASNSAISGWVTVRQYNSPNWERAMVRSFTSAAQLSSFCR